MVRITWLVSQLIPPALLTYFGRTLYLIVTEIGPIYVKAHVGPRTATAYTLTALLAIPAISVLYLRLYFLPANQSVPPRNPPAPIVDRTTIFECLSSAEAEVIRSANDEPAEAAGDGPMVNRCWRGKCGGRWKPARARHCSECGTCRAGFDHHCALVSFLGTVVRSPR